VKVQELLQERVDRDIWFYSLTLEPHKDSPEELARYAKRFGVGPGFLFLTGRPQDLELLRRELGFTLADPLLDADLTSHIGIVKLGNEPWGWWGDTASLAAPSQIASLLEWVAAAGDTSRARRAASEGGT
jgi:protein SCO1/2